MPKKLRDIVSEEVAGAPANCAGGGAVAAIGVGPKGEPPGPMKRRAMIRRKAPVQ